jgi:hypothetical protein
VPDRKQEAVALLRRACQLFDSAGESERSMRAVFTQTAFHLLLDVNSPEQQAEFDKCDADPMAYLSAKR